ncbi:MAG TPA: class I SAM-dependent methyltransferase [Gemmatimonadaceae bacterium]|nr:class I SAM-dependent methyltransferase [Gemmatimonadaceae bacterium]
MSGVAEHYEALLAERYSWMFGDFEARVAAQRSLLQRLGVPAPGPSSGRRALDLGAGSGFQSLALAEMGYRVTAVDTSRRLLAELEARRGALPIEVVHADMLDVLDVPAVAAAREAGGYDVAVCMGDTLTHLAARGEVRRLFRSVRASLAPRGLFVLTFRDYTRPLAGLDRFIPVRATDDAIMTCVLEYEPDHVIVHDLLHERTERGWELRKSAYRKLRLAPAWTAGALADAGFGIEHQSEESGICGIVARAAAS